MPAEMLMRYWGYILAAIVVLVLTYFVYDERDPEERAAETTKKVGSRTSNAVGGLVGVVVAIFIGLGTTLMQTAMELGDLAMPLMEFVGGNPEVSSGLVVTVLGWLSMSGLAPIGATTFVGVALIIVGAGVAIAAYGDESTG
jgi:choline-glycine betaine transporter